MNTLAGTHASDLDKLALSDITVFNKYARFDALLGRRENWHEIVTRNLDMHKRKYPAIAQMIQNVYDWNVYNKKVLPSMRSLQFGGRPIELAHNRIYNCAYAPVESPKFFSELMFLLLGGTGMGYSVQKRHVGQLPKVKTPESDEEYKFQIQDSIVGWADAIKVVCKAFFNAGTLPVFDYRDIRDKNTDLVTTGGKAPGPDPLRKCIEEITRVFRGAIGRKMTPLEAHDIACSIADSVRAGGIRRAAMIALFDLEDEQMMDSKNMSTVAMVDIKYEQLSSGERGAPVQAIIRNVYGEKFTIAVSQYDIDTYNETGKVGWYHAHPARARSNNSAVLLRGEVGEKQFADLMVRVKNSGCGEPGIYWTNNKDWGTNPCCEIALRPYQMCNLTEINAGAITDQASFNAAAEAAAFIGTLQAGYTDFHYLNPKWRKSCEKEALLGVSMTGIASGTIDNLDSEEAVRAAIETNRIIAKLIGINPAARVTAVKPAGTTSLVLGTSSGIHSWHAAYYIRRQRAGKDEALAQYLMRVVPELVEEDVTDPKQVVLSFPQKAPAGAIMRDEAMVNLLERVKTISEKWVAAGHVKGINKHNVSCTISVKDDEWEELTAWMWSNRESYNGISVLPFYGSAAYKQLPFEDITKEEYERLLPLLQKIDVGQVFEANGDNIDLKGEAACAGGVCEYVM